MARRRIAFTRAASLAEVEGLDDVVVRAEFQTLDSVLLVGAGRDEQDGHRAVLADRAAQVEPATSRKHDVEDHEVGPHLTEEAQALFRRLGSEGEKPSRRIFVSTVSRMAGSSSTISRLHERPKVGVPNVCGRAPFTVMIRLGEG